jgi:hypothetical protein
MDSYVHLFNPSYSYDEKTCHEVFANIEIE